MLANGPVRLVFELEYAPFEVNGISVAEVKRKIETGESMSTAVFAAPVTVYHRRKSIPWWAVLLMVLGIYLVLLAIDALQVMRNS